MTKRTILLLVPAFLLLTALATTTPGPPPRPAPDGLTTSRTWTDDDIDRIMKQVGPTAANLRKLVDAKQAPAAEAHADTLQYYFDEVEEFFDARKITEAEEFAQQAGEHANHVEDAVEADDFATADEHLKLLTATCQSCHSKFRERLPDGSYQLKKN
jgi:cytochrome c556